MSGQKPSPVLGRTSSDGLIHLIRATAPLRQMSSDVSANSSDMFNAPKRNKTSPVLPITNGSHPAVNGASTLHTSGSVRKSPLLPPTHSSGRKSDSSDSSSSLKSDSSGSVFRPTAQSSNQDGQLSDHSSSSLHDHGQSECFL